MVGFRTQSLHIITPPGILYAQISCDLTVSTVMCNELPRTFLSYSGDAIRSFNVQPPSKLCRDVRKRLFSIRIWSPWYKHVNSDVKQSFDHSVTVRKSLLGVKLGVMNCQSIGGKLDFVFDHIKEYQLDIVALTETWLSKEDSKNKHVIDQCVEASQNLFAPLMQHLKYLKCSLI